MSILEPFLALNHDLSQFCLAIEPSEHKVVLGDK
jgi:hypothetical protein